MQTFMLSKLLLFCNKCTAMLCEETEISWELRNTYTKRLCETLTCAIFVYIALDVLLNSQK